MTVERVPWEDYRRWLKRRAAPGQHAVIIGSTGSGKSILAGQVVPMFGHNIAVFDGKGGDDPSLLWPGFHRILTWPPPEEGMLLRSISSRAREPIRVLLAPKMNRVDELPRTRDIFAGALDDIYTRRKKAKLYAVYFDEFGALADPRKMGLGPKAEILLQQLRYRPASVITGMQFPTWLPKPAYREATHRWFFQVHDEDSLKYIASVTGRRKEVLPALEGLRRYEFLHQDIRTDRLIVSKVKLEKG